MAIELPCEADVHCAPETIEISSGPVVLGTTYREPGPLGVRNGTVTEFVSPTNVAAHESRRTLRALKTYADTLA
jgi:hypothetical protein